MVMILYTKPSLRHWQDHDHGTKIIQYAITSVW